MFIFVIYVIKKKKLKTFQEEVKEIDDRSFRIQLRNTVAERLRDRLDAELTETKMDELVENNKNFLVEISSGKSKCERHNMFGNIETRNKLNSMCILDPFSENHYDWAKAKIEDKLFSSNKEERRRQFEYTQKVSLI